MDKLAQAFAFLLANKRIFGAVIGLLFGILFLIIGFWKSVALAFFIFIGWFVGKMMDDKEDWRDVIEKLVPPKYRD